MRASLTPSGVIDAGQSMKMLVDFSSATQLQMNSLCDQYKEDVIYSILIGITIFVALAIALGIPIIRFVLKLQLRNWIKVVAVALYCAIVISIPIVHVCGTYPHCKKYTSQQLIDQRVRQLQFFAQTLVQDKLFEN